MSTHNEILKRIQQERNAVAKLYGSSTKSLTEESICEMAWKMFPEDVVSNPKELYLDYACGKGNILLYGVEYLYKKLMNKIKNPKKRLDHIIKKQLHGVDNDQSQIDITRSALKRILKEPDALLNIERTDSLTKDFSNMKKKFNVITNVPFQNGKNPNYYKEFRFDLNDRFKEIFKYKIIISPNYMTLTSKESNNNHLAIYKDLGNAFKSITLPAGVCVTREDPQPTKNIRFTDINNTTSIVSKKDFVVVTDSSVLPIIKKIQQGKTLGCRYIHDSNKFETEVKNGPVFYVDFAGKTDKDVEGFYVDAEKGNIRTGSFVVFAYNAPGDPLDVGNKRLGPTKVLQYGDYIFSSSVVALQFETETESKNCKKLLDSDWSKNIIRSVKYATNNSKSLLDVLPDLDFKQEYNEDNLIAKFK